MSDDDRFLRRAVALAARDIDAGGGPFGAVITRGGDIIAEGTNRVTVAHDPTAHAEIVAIRAACRALDDFSLAGCVIHSSCEPCPMCLGAIYWARLSRVHHAATRADAAAIGFDDQHIYDEFARPPAARRLPIFHRPLPEADALFKAWAAKPDKVPY